MKKDGAGRGNWGKLGDYDDEYEEEFYEEEPAENLSVSETASEGNAKVVYRCMQH